MKKWVAYVLGVITGMILTVALAYCVNLSNNAGVIGLELFDEPGECMEYSQFEVFQVVESGCALAHAGDSFGSVVLIMPNENQRLYDGQKIELKSDECAQRIGTYKYGTRMDIERTVPAVRIIDGVDSAEIVKKNTNKKIAGKTLFDEPGECVSRKNFEVQRVLESGDAIALEISDQLSGLVITSDLEVLIQAQKGSNFYDNQIIKTPKGKCARQVGTYTYKKYGDTKVIPIVSFE